jgi:isoquinoline 1-oxidoreductase
MADTELTPFDAGTFGSRTTPDMAQQLHRVAAAAREALVDLAAEFFKVERASLTVCDGKIARTDTKESVTFGQLTKGQKLLKSIEDRSQHACDQWKSPARPAEVDGRDFVTASIDTVPI